MPIRCQSSEVDFNVVVAAALLEGPSTSLSGSSDALLAVVFQSRRDDNDDKNVSSALCVYRMSQVRQRFTTNIRRCFAGQQKYVGLQFGNRLCVSLVSGPHSSHCIPGRLTHVRVLSVKVACCGVSNEWPLTNDHCFRVFPYVNGTGRNSVFFAFKCFC